MKITNVLKRNGIILCIIAFCISCSDDDENSINTTDYKEQNNTEIVTYLDENKITATKTASGLYYKITEEGTGSQPIATDKIIVNYKGYYRNQAIFDASNKPISFSLNRVISGWTEGLQYFKKGGKGTLWVPAHLGYGNNPPPGILRGEVLIFDIELLEIESSE